ncbi:hypothetical protein NIES4073_20690 [Kalymmatonema gypsitolerans NIES-4073]|nr:hypothetical protein NIES4073_20690 [Scytonema sp. NIES-4073]
MRFPIEIVIPKSSSHARPKELPISQSLDQA